MMAQYDTDENYPPPFSLDGGLLSTLQSKKKIPQESDDPEEDTRDAALILTSLSTKEFLQEKKECPMSPKFSQLVSIFEEEYQNEKKIEKNRIRAVSFSHPSEIELPSSSLSCSSPPASPILSYSMPISTPPHSPVTRHGKKKKRQVAIVSPGSKLCLPLIQKEGGGRNKVILRRKFSWKNYPELEAFLIANREEYLRHSALNYTIQQKQYNNRLTERLLELAAKHGYVFDEEAFSFVTVRDRIRCYYKSYVQSSKKRGIIIGYAARKAGLLSEDDLEKSAGMVGRIVVPTLN